MANYQRLKRRRLALWKEDPRCTFCGVKTVLPEDTGIFFINKRGQQRQKGKTPDNMATIEHLDSRYSVSRGKNNREERTVLCCNKCNQKRNDIEQNILVPLEVKQIRSKGNRAPRIEFS